MPKQILFIHGAGTGAYKEDTLLAEQLQQELGPDYQVQAPAFPDEDDPKYSEWKAHIHKELANMQEPVAIVGHSIGGSVALKYLHETGLQKPLSIFSLAAPYWGGEGWHYDGYEQLMLPMEPAVKQPQGTAVFLYHCQDDPFIPLEHLGLFKTRFPDAKTNQPAHGGHQFDGAITVVAHDIRTL
jgi:predicted alpha/beta hydrolase family esterase